MLRSSIVILGLCYGAISACLGSINQPWFRMMEWLRPAPWPSEHPATTRPAASRNCMGLLPFGNESETIWVVLLSMQTQHDKTNRSHSWTHAFEWISGITEISGVPPPHGGCTAPLVLQVSAGVLRALMGPIPRTVSGPLLFKGFLMLNVFPIVPFQERA